MAKTRIRTRKEMLNFVATFGACEPAREWVRQHPKNDAEAIWLSCTRLDWIAWLITHSAAEHPAATLRKLRWHLVQTSLDVLGAEFVHQHDLNKPLQSLARSRDVLDNVQYMAPFMSRDPQQGALYQLEVQLKSASLYDLEPDITWSSNRKLNQRYIEDIRHVLSWDDVVAAFE